MKRKLALIMGSLILASSIVNAKDIKKVYVNQIVDHPALDMTAKGIEDGLKKHGYINGENLDFRVESAQASVPLASQISAKFVSQKADVTVGLGTPSAQSLVKAAKSGNTKLVFSSITDPIGAGLVTSLTGSNNNITGMSNYVDVGPQLAMFKEVTPNLKKLGFIYNPADANSLKQYDDLVKAAPNYDITVVRQVINRTSEVPQAATHVAGKADAIFIYGDNTALSALETIIMAANKAGIPVYVADTDAVVLGALASLGPSQYEHGLETADMIADILNGKDINQIPVGFPTKMERYLNTDAAKKLGINLPQSLIDSAAKVISAEAKP